MGRLPPFSPLSPEGAERSGAPRRAKPGGVDRCERGETLGHAADGGSVGPGHVYRPVSERAENHVTTRSTSRVSAAEHAAEGMHAKAAPPTPLVAIHAF